MALVTVSQRVSPQSIGSAASFLLHDPRSIPPSTSRIVLVKHSSVRPDTTTVLCCVWALTPPAHSATDIAASPRKPAQFNKYPFHSSAVSGMRPTGYCCCIWFAHCAHCAAWSPPSQAATNSAGYRRVAKKRTHFELSVGAA